MSRRVIVLWADPDSGNFGVRALFEGLKDALRAASSEPVELIPVSHGTKLGSGATPNRRHWSRALRDRGHPLAQILRSADLVVDVGEGDSFADIYGGARLQAMVAGKVVARRWGVAPVMAPQTIGPFGSMQGHLLGAIGLAAAQRVWARDSASFACARRHSVRNISLASDMAFAMQPAELGLAQSWDLGLNVSGLLWEQDNKDLRENYRLAIHKIIMQSRNAGRSILLVPHVLNPGASDDDGRATAVLAAEYGVPVAQSLVASYGAREAKALLGRCRLVVAARMHAAIAAVSQGVATVPMAYSRKFQGLFGDLGYAAVVDTRTASSDALTLEVERAFASAEDLRAMAVTANATALRELASFTESIMRTMRK